MVKAAIDILGRIGVLANCRFGELAFWLLGILTAWHLGTITEDLGTEDFGIGGRRIVETYDILMLAVLVGATLFGAIKGFAWQVASIASIVVSYVVAYRFREPFSEVIKAEPPWNRFLAMLILYVGTSLVIWMLFRMVSRSIDKLKLKEFDRQIGAAFGFGKGVLFCTLITMFAVTLFGPDLRAKIVGSRSGYYIAKVLDKSDMIIPPELHEVVAPYIERFESELAQPSDQPGLLPEGVFDGAGLQDGLPRWQSDIPAGGWSQDGGTGLPPLDPSGWIPERAQQSGSLPPLR